MTTEEPIRVLIADDHQIVRQGFVMFISAFDDMELVGEARDGEEAVALCSQLKPDVVLMDMVMPRMDGPTAIARITEAQPDIRIVGLTSFTDDGELVTKALEAGAAGYLFKDVSIDDLASAIRKVNSGDPVLAPNATRMLIQSRTKPQPRDFGLTDREREVLELVKEGLNNSQIAERLYLSRSTVKFHVSSILGKLNAASRTEAVAIAMEHNLLD